MAGAGQGGNGLVVALLPRFPSVKLACAIMVTSFWRHGSIPHGFKIELPKNYTTNAESRVDSMLTVPVPGTIQKF